MHKSNLPLWRVVVSIPGLNIDKYILSETEPTLEQIQAVWDADGGSRVPIKPRGWVGPLRDAYPGVGLVERVVVANLTVRAGDVPPICEAGSTAEYDAEPSVSGGGGSGPRGGELHRRLVALEVRAEVDEYELRGEDGDYTPTEAERVLLEDFGNGLVSTIEELLWPR